MGNRDPEGFGPMTCIEGESMGCDCEKLGGHNWGRLLGQEKGKNAGLQEREIAGEKGRFEGGRSRWQRGANIWAAIEKNRWRRRANSWATEQLKIRWALICWLQGTGSKEITFPVRDRIPLQMLAVEGWDFILDIEYPEDDLNFPGWLLYDKAGIEWRELLKIDCVSCERSTPVVNKIEMSSCK